MPGRIRQFARTNGDPVLEVAVTRRDQAARLDALGVPDTVASDLLALWAPDRHRARVAAARAAIAGVTPPTALPEAMVSLVVELDAYGVGGTADVTGAGTVRHPALAECGSGRKHAADGRAWTESIQVSTGLPWHLPRAVCGSDCPTPPTMTCRGNTR